MSNRRLVLLSQLVLLSVLPSAVLAENILPISTGIAGTLRYDACSNLPQGTVCIWNLQPLSTQLYVVSHEKGGSKVVARVKSDARGSFRLVLPVGTYSIEIDPIVDRKKTVVNGRAFEVRSGKISTIDLVAEAYTY